MKISENILKWSLILIFGVLVFWVGFGHLFKSDNNSEEIDIFSDENFPKWQKDIEAFEKLSYETLKECWIEETKIEQEACRIKVCRDILYPAWVILQKKWGREANENSFMRECAP